MTLKIDHGETSPSAFETTQNGHADRVPVSSQKTLKDYFPYKVTSSKSEAHASPAFKQNTTAVFKLQALRMFHPSYLYLNSTQIYWQHHRATRKLMLELKMVESGLIKATAKIKTQDHISSRKFSIQLKLCPTKLTKSLNPFLSYTVKPLFERHLYLNATSNRTPLSRKS